MRAYLFQIDAWSGSTAVPLRLASHNDDRLCHLNGQTWWPAVATLPTLRYDFFDGGFDPNGITSPEGSFTVALDAIPGLPALAIHDARVQIWRGNLGDPYSAFTAIFDGRVKEQPNVADGIATVNIGVDDSWLDQPLLSTYAGTGAAEGATSLQGQVKPLALGAPLFAPAVLVDAVDNIYQVSAYGAITGIPMAFDRLTRFGAATANYASFAALKAATVDRGRWATSLAGGYVRLGAPADGMVSFHVQGDAVGGWARLPGDMIARVATIAGGLGKFSTLDMSALNAARPWNLSIMVTAQTTARELIQRIAASVNSVAYVDWLGVLRVAAIAIGAPTATMAADGSALPPVTNVEQVAVAAPYWKVAQGAVPTWQVHDASDIAFNINAPRGIYDSAEIYREGDLVSLSDGSQWLYINTVPNSGSAPAIGNPDWQQLTPPVVAVDSEGNPLETIIAEVSDRVDAKRTIFTGPIAPTAAESEENDWWQQTDASGSIIGTYRRVAGTGRLAIGGNAILLGGNYIGLCWAPVEDARIGSALAAATAASNLADSKAVVFTMYASSDPVPTGTDIGDILVRTYLNPVQVDYWNGSAWAAAATYGATAAQITLIGSALTSAANAQATADGKVDTYYQTSAPAGATVGDLWFDTDDGNKLYRHNGSGWVAAQDTAIGQAITAAAGAQATADGKVTTYVGEAAPGAPALGDLWFKASTNVLSRWNGAAWGTVSSLGAPSGTNVGSTPATTVESGANAANNGLNSDGTVKTDKVGTGAVVAGSIHGITTASGSGSSAAFSTIHELAYVTVASLPSGVTGIKISAYGQLRYTGGPTAGYPVLRLYRIPAANAASYLASASGTNRNPASYGTVTGKNATLANWANVDMAASIQHSSTSPAAGDLYVIAADVAAYPPAAGAWSYNWAGEVSIDIVKR